MDRSLSKIKFHPESVSISPFSRSSVQVNPIRLDQDGKEIARSNASGFFWNEHGKLLLFTNYHVVSGVNTITGMHLAGWVPNGCEISFFAESPRPSENNRHQHALFRYKARIEFDDSMLTDAWHIHARGYSVDLAAISIDWQDSNIAPVCLNLTGLVGEFDGQAGEDVFVIGYPEGQNFERGLPLWKRGSIATDPELDQRNLPQYYIDTIGNGGLSGSFVLLKKEVSLIGDSVGRTRHKYAFAGVYAGRLGVNGIENQVGRVFKASAVKDIVDSFLE